MGVVAAHAELEVLPVEVQPGQEHNGFFLDTEAKLLVQSEIATACCILHLPAPVETAGQLKQDLEDVVQRNFWMDLEGDRPPLLRGEYHRNIKHTSLIDLPYGDYYVCPPSWETTSYRASSDKAEQ